MALAVLAVGCERDEIPTKRAELQRDAAAKLQMPGARSLREVGGDQQATPTGPTYAFTGYIAGTERMPEDVRAHFDRELRTLGWIVDLPPALGGAERDGWGWCKPKTRFRLTIADPVRLARIGVDLGPDLPPTIFDARLIASGRECPAPVPTWPPNVP